MKERDIYNLNMLISVKVRDKREMEELQYVPASPEKRVWFFWKEKATPAGWQYIFWGYGQRLYSAEELRNGEIGGIRFLVDEEKKMVYHRPFIKVTFSKEEGFTHQYDTYQSAWVAAEKIIKQGVPAGKVHEINY